MTDNIIVTIQPVIAYDDWQEGHTDEYQDTLDLFDAQNLQTGILIRFRPKPNDNEIPFDSF